MKHPTRPFPRHPLFSPRALLFSIIAATLLTVAGARGARAQAENGKIDDQQAAAVEQTIQEVRLLKLKHKVPVVVRSTEEAGKLLEAELESEYTPEAIDTDGRAGALIGLYPPGVNLKAANMSLLESQVIAFYDFKKKTMVVVNGALEREFPGQPPELQTKLDNMILAHEFTHALQDQNFDFGARDEALKSNGDRALALHSVAEGDATIAGYACMLGRMDSVILATLIGNLKSFSQTFTGAAAGVPRGVAEPLIFQYTDGVRFVAEAYQRGGWKAVDKLYIDPPQSTQQIIDPSLYFDHPTLPDTVTVAGYQSRMAGWHKSDEDTLGELGPAHHPGKHARHGLAGPGARRPMGGRPDRDAAQGRNGDGDLAADVSRRRFGLALRGRLSQGARSHAWPSGGASRRTQRQGGARGDRRCGRALRPAWAGGMEGQCDHRCRRRRLRRAARRFMPARRPSSSAPLRRLAAAR